jgi:hypothetical protein
MPRPDPIGRLTPEAEPGEKQLGATLLEPTSSTRADDHPPPPPRQRPGVSPRRVLAALLIVATGVAGVTWWLASRAKSPRQVAAEASAPRPSAILAPVELRGLKTVVAVRGRVVAPPASRISVAPAVENGEPIATATTLIHGATVEEGTVVAEIALRPVIVLSGTIPMFRDLELGSRGRDVLQLQQALLRRGFTTETDGILGPATAIAVNRLYEFRGYQPPNPRVGTDRRARVRPVVVRSEMVFVRDLPARLVGSALRVGQRAKGVVAKLATGGVFIRAEATTADRDYLRVGSPVVIRVGGRRLRGRVVSIGSRRRVRNTDLQAHPVTIRPNGSLSRRLVGRDVNVGITARSTPGRELVVPVAAISAAADGSARITRVRSGESSTVTVRPGMSANGFVAVRANRGGLRVGDEVVVGR